jgi:hypothetical protein
MRDSARPTSRKDFFKSSDLNALRPENSSEAIAGRSSSTTTSTCPSISRRTSLKKPVANKALIAAAAFSSVIVSPTLTGRYENTVPASVRWIPSTRMSLIGKGSNADADVARKRRDQAGKQFLIHLI